MDKFLYISMTGAKEALDAQRLRANNLANVSTSGFKADFHQYRTMAVFGDHFPSRAYAMSERPGTDKSEGVYMETARDLDLAIKGKGWFAVQMPDGSEAYTRAGDFQLSAFGELLTGGGLPVLGNAGPIAIPPNQKIEIGSDGTISVREQGQGAESITAFERIRLVNPAIADLQKGGDGLFRRTDGNIAIAEGSVKVQSGFLEASNVNVVDSMVNMISLSRNYEMNIKMIKSAEENSETSAQLLQVR